MPKIFDRFYRVRSHEQQAIPGSGLGLAIVQSIVNLHQGEITVASTPKKGTTIHLKFSPI